MGYVDSVLEPDEQVLQRGRLHWIIYLPGIPFFVAGLTILAVDVHNNSREPIASMAAAFVLLSALLLWLTAWIKRVTTEIAVTDHRVIFKRGLVWRSTMEMNAGQIESVHVRQTIWGRILNFGTVTIGGTGSGIEPIHNVTAPLIIRKAISQISRNGGNYDRRRDRPIDRSRERVGR
jgi:uncharacterized membrane protein YdbT with pleckstrin-like domain